MKFTIDVDCTPEEARRFLGLPDVTEMQASLMKDLEGRLKSSLAAMDPEAMIRTWLPASIQGFEQMRQFWSQMAAVDPSAQRRAKEPKDK
jgi:Family of unknown function (DUF6489)